MLKNISALLADNYGEILSQGSVEDYISQNEHPPPFLSIDTTEAYHAPNSLIPERLQSLRDRPGKTKFVIHHPFQVNIAHPVEELRHAGVRYCIDLLHAAHRIDAAFLILHGGYAPGVTKKYEALRAEALSRMIASLHELTPIAEALGVKIALENFPLLPRESDRQEDIIWLLTRVEDFEEVFSRIHSPSLRVLFEIGHANVQSNPIEFYRSVKTHVIGAHVSDNHGVHDEHLDIGRGTIDWDGLIWEFAKNSFTGPFFMDMSMESKDVHAHAAEFSVFWDKCLALGTS